MQRKGIGPQFTQSLESSSSSSFHIDPLLYRYAKNYDEDSSSLSSFCPTEPLVKIRPPSYAAMQQNRSPSSFASSFSVRSRFSSIYSFFAQERKTSIFGPTQSARERLIFLSIISLMTFCGANNDFLGKLCYQSLPGTAVGFVGLRNRYWIAWLLTFGTFIICAIAIIFGKDEWRTFKKEMKMFLVNVSVPGSCDVWVNGGRYIGLVFLDAAVVTVLKNGTQLLFSALFRKIVDKKTLSNSQTFGILLVVIGLILVCVAIFLNEMGASGGSMAIGIAIMITVGAFGSIRNHYEQILTRDLSYNPSFVVGMRSFVSIFWILLIAIVLLSVPALYETESNNNIHNDSGWSHIHDGVVYICSYPLFLVSLALFVCAIYGKNITQMKVIQMSSALTRNLTMQLMPIGTWILSLITYFINPRYGEEWNNYSYIRLLGFIIVLIGSYLYMKIPKNMDESCNNLQKQCEMKPTVSVTQSQSHQDVDLYGTISQKHTIQ